MFQGDIKRIDAVFQKPLSSLNVFYSSSLNKMIKIFEYSLSIEDMFPVFLVGEVGSGKSVLLQILCNSAKKTHQTYFLHRPLPDKDTYIEFLCEIAHIRYEKGLDDEAFIREITKKSLKPTVLFIDAFELMSYEQMVLTFKLKNIPLLSIVCATRTHEAEKIFNNKHFDLNHKVYLNYNPLSEEEIKNYIHFILEYSQETSHSKLFTPSVCKEIQQYTRGNWHALNQFLHTLFKLIAYETLMGNGVRKLSCVMLAKIAYELKLVSIERFKKKCLLYQVAISFTMFGSLFEVLTILVLIAILFFSYRSELNATVYPSLEAPKYILESPVKEEHNTLTLRVRFPS